jgi:hypothetical protein
VRRKGCTVVAALRRERRARKRYRAMIFDLRKRVCYGDRKIDSGERGGFLGVWEI